MALRQARLEEAAGLLHPQPAATEEAPAEDQRLAALPGLQPAVGGQQRLHAQALAEVSQEQGGDVAPKSSTLSSLYWKILVVIQFIPSIVVYMVLNMIYKK